MALSKIRNDSLEDTAVHGRRNLIINGAMQISQRGTSSTTSGRHTVDRFFNTFGTVAVTQTQDTTVPSNEGFSHSYKNECTTASSATGAFFGISYHVEAQDIRNSGWDYTSSSSKITLSFYARSSVAGTYMASLRTDDGTQYNIASQYTLVADTWKRVELTFPGNSNLTINDDSGIGLKVFPMLELGSDYTSGSSFDTWTAHGSGTQSPDANILFHDTANATFFVTGVQLEVGDEATPFEHRSFGEELSLCHRYTFAMQGTGDPLGSKGGAAIVGGARGFWGFGSAHNSSNPVVWMEMPTAMRGVPSLTKSNNGHFDFDRGWAGLATSTNTIVQTLRSSSKTLAIILTTSGLSNGDAGSMSANNSAAYMIYDAEI